jgi:hypothetical protein
VCYILKAAFIYFYWVASEKKINRKNQPAGPNHHQKLVCGNQSNKWTSVAADIIVRTSARLGGSSWEISKNKIYLLGALILAHAICLVPHETNGDTSSIAFHFVLEDLLRLGAFKL